MIVFRAAGWTIALALSAGLFAHEEGVPQGSPQEAFRSGIDLVQLDVTVLDARQRPVRGLTADDFTILEEGKPQSIRTFAPVDVPPPMALPAARMRETPVDVVSNDQDARRLVVMVMDDAYTRYDPGTSLSARTIARAAVGELGSADLAAVVFTFTGRAQTFTTDRTQLLSAVESFVPKVSGSGPPLACRMRRCGVETLANVAALLRSAPPGRKLIVFIGSPGGLNVTTDPLPNLTPVQEMFRAMQEANVAVNAFDPSGLRTYGPLAEDRSERVARGRVLASRASLDELRALAENTGGKTFVNTNAPEAHVPAVFEQNSSYYLLGFHSADTVRDGRFRRIQVRVNQPGATVRTRSGYFAPRTGDQRPRAEPSRSVEAAIESGLPARELPVQMHVAMFAVPSPREVAVAVTAALRSPTAHDGTDAAPFELMAAAFDTDTRPRGRFRQTVRLPASEGDAGSLYDVHSRLPLRPGRYELRLAVEHGGRTGSVLANIDVPDFAREELTLSDLVLARGGRPAANGPLADLLPVEPTTVRDFDTSDRVTAFLRIYRHTRAANAPLSVATRILDEAQEVVFERADEYGSDRVARDRSADHQLELPLAGLPAGHYLLVVEAPRPQDSLRRTARFTVR